MSSPKPRGFTLIELMISVAITVIIASAVYFAVNSALESWSYCRDQLSIQKVLAETMDRVISGTHSTFGLKDSLEIVEAGRTRMDFVPPWLDNTHITASRDFVYTLNRRMKPGAPVPIAEIRMPDQSRWKLIPVEMVPLEAGQKTELKLNLSVPEGSELRFAYHPDWKNEPETIRALFWDKKTKELMMESAGTVESISKNLFGVEILSVKFSYYTANNELVTDRELVEDSQLQLITGIRVEIEAKLNEQTRKLDRFVNLRNAPMRTGYLALLPNMKIPIPDSKHIKTLMITNLSGISDNDVLQLEALSRSGDAWRITIEFEKIGSSKPLIRKINVEYPPQHTVFTDYPKITAEIGVNLLILGNDGLYDYDDDEDTDDVVNVEGDVILYVNEMTVEGAGLFVRP